MADAERLLQLLVHDLRAPLGVATGYLRLLQDGRLPTADDQRFALVRTLDALGRIAHLCDVVNEASDPPERIGGTRAEDFVTRVAARLPVPGHLARAANWDADVEVTVGADADRLAEAVARVISVVGKRVPEPTVAVGVRGQCLRFALGPDTGPDGVRPGGEFDPWRGFGLEVVLACKAIAAVGGHVWSRDATDLIVELPSGRPHA